MAGCPLYIFEIVFYFVHWKSRTRINTLGEPKSRSPSKWASERRDWWYQRNRILKKNGQHNVQKKKDKQRSTKHRYKTKDRVTRTPLKTGVNSGRVSSSCSTSGTRRVKLVTIPVISREWGQNWEVEYIRGHFQNVFVKTCHELFRWSN